MVFIVQLAVSCKLAVLVSVVHTNGLGPAVWFHAHARQ